VIKLNRPLPGSLDPWMMRGHKLPLMLENIHSVALVGLRAYRVRVEVAITRGTPMIQIVGLAAGAVREGKERIRAAVSQIGLHVPGLRITVNLAPADVRKHGAAFDLPITVGILAAAGQVSAVRARRYAMVGELGLDGRLRGVRGALSIAMHCRGDPSLHGLIMPVDNLAETSPVDGLDIVGAATLGQVLDFLAGRALTTPGRGAETGEAAGGASVAGAAGASGGASLQEAPDMADVRGQQRVKRALEIAAAGGHNLLLRGEPGAGKTMLARRLPSILPEMSLAEAVEVTTVHSVAGRLPAGGGIVRTRPFRAPHHTVSQVGLVGGGILPHPGEISLAHRGVLFLDELTEFRVGALEALRQPLEEGCVTVVRGRTAATFPARFIMVAAMNPCPCGYLTSPAGTCTCDPGVVRRYQGKVSGPLLDRIDLHVDVPAVPWRDLRSGAAGEASATVRARVTEARLRAAHRTAAEGRTHEKTLSPDAPSSDTCNAAMSVRDVRIFCRLDPAAEAILGRALERFGLSARGCHRILKLARTIADLARSDAITSAHVAEAVQYRVLDRRAGV